MARRKAARKEGPKDNRKYLVKNLKGVRLGPRPFMTGIEYYRVRRAAYAEEGTIYEDCRKLKYNADVFKDLKAQGRVRTTDPRHMDQMDIEAFLIWMRSKKYEVSTRRKYLSCLNSYLKFWGNHALADMWARGDLRPFLKGEEKDIEFLELEELQQIFEHIQGMEGYDGIVFRGYISIIFGIAGRPKEVIDARVGDVNTKDWMFYVRHPKAEGSWGKKEWISIVRQDVHPMITTFLQERKAYLKARGIRSDYLFVNPETLESYSLKHIRDLKYRAERECGVKFKLKVFRPTWATLTFSKSPKMGLSINKQLRHEKFDTSKKYYIAYRNKQAKKDLQYEWEKTPLNLKK